MTVLRQTIMRTLGPNVQLENYGWLSVHILSRSYIFPIVNVHRFSPSGPAAVILSPDDIYIASLMGTLEALNAGVTTTLDFAHMTWTRAHAEAALHGVIDSGARVWWCYRVGSVVVSGDPYTGMYCIFTFVRVLLLINSVNTSAPIDQLAHIRELAKDNPFNGGLVTLGLAADPPTTEVVETAQFVSFPAVEVLL
jgi:hypothetical protein